MNWSGPFRSRLVVLAIFRGAILDIVLLVDNGMGRIYRAAVPTDLALVVTDRTEANEPETWLTPPGYRIAITLTVEFDAVPGALGADYRKAEKDSGNVIGRVRSVDWRQLIRPIKGEVHQPPQA